MCLWGMRAYDRAGSQARGTGSPAQRVPRCAYGGCETVIARAHRQGGRGVQPSRWSQLTMRVLGMAPRDGARSQARWTWSLAQPVVAAHGVFVLRVPRAREPAPLGADIPHSVVMMPPLMAQAHRLGGKEFGSLGGRS